MRCRLDHSRRDRVSVYFVQDVVDLFQVFYDVFPKRTPRHCANRTGSDHRRPSYPPHPRISDFEGKRCELVEATEGPM